MLLVGAVVFLCGFTSWQNNNRQSISEKWPWKLKMHSLLTEHLWICFRRIFYIFVKAGFKVRINITWEKTTVLMQKMVHLKCRLILFMSVIQIMEKVLRFSRLLSIFKSIVEYFGKVSPEDIFLWICIGNIWICCCDFFGEILTDMACLGWTRPL